MTEASPSENIVLLFTLIMQNLLINVLHSLKHSLKIAFIALTLLAGRQEEHLACKNSVRRSWCGYLSEARSRLFAYGPADATAIPKPHQRLVLPFWYWLIHVVPEKTPLNGCSSSSSSSSIST